MDWLHDVWMGQLMDAFIDIWTDDRGAGGATWVCEATGSFEG